MCCLQVTHFTDEDPHRLKVKLGKKYCTKGNLIMVWRIYVRITKK